MEDLPYGQFELIEEWTIENFSCWNEEIHGDKISSPNSGSGFCLFRLHPRSNRGISVTLERVLYLRKLDFIGPDGSVIYTQEIEASYEEVFDDYGQGDFGLVYEETFEDTYEELSIGITFEEIVAQFQNNEALKDVLTLRLWRENYIGSVTYIRSVICVEDISLNISSRLFDQLDSSDENKVYISSIDPNHITWPGLDFHAFINESDNSKIDFKWDYEGDKKILLRTHTYVLDKDHRVMRWRENDHLFQGKEQWTVVDPLTRKELKEGSLLVRVKIVSEKMLEFHYKIQTPKYHVEASSTISLRPLNLRAIVQKTSKSQFTDNSVDALTKDLMCLYQERKFSDFQLKCGDVTFPVHKVILSARSPVFKTMLSTDMTEAALGQVVIQDLDPSTLSLFLTYLYTGTVEDLQYDSALKLYYAADKYQVPSIKGECVKFLGAHVFISNVCDILSFGNKHSDDAISSAAHDFILDNYNAVLKSKEWASFLESEPLLAAKTLTHFATKYNFGKLNSR